MRILGDKTDRAYGSRRASRLKQNSYGSNFRRHPLHDVCLIRKLRSQLSCQINVPAEPQYEGTGTHTQPFKELDFADAPRMLFSKCFLTCQV